MSGIYSEHRSMNETAICGLTPCVYESEICTSLYMQGVSGAAPVGVSHLLRRSCQEAEEIMLMLLLEQFGGLLCRADVQPLATLTLLHSNKQSFSSKSCYLHRFGVNPGT